MQQRRTLKPNHIPILYATYRAGRQEGALLKLEDGRMDVRSVGCLVTWLVSAVKFPYLEYLEEKRRTLPCNFLYKDIKFNDHFNILLTVVNTVWFGI